MSTFFFLRKEIPAHDVLLFTGGGIFLPAFSGQEDAYSHLKLPVAKAHMLWPHYDTGSRSINRGINRAGNNNNRRPHLFVEYLRFFPFYFATIFTIFFGT